MNLLPPISTLFPYTTLFRSVVPRRRLERNGVQDRGVHGGQRGSPSSAPRAARADHGRGGRDARRLHGRRHRSEEHTSELQSQSNLVCRLLLEKKKINSNTHH